MVITAESQDGDRSRQEEKQGGPDHAEDERGSAKDGNSPRYAPASPEPTASAIWRTPLLLIPSPAMLWAKSTIAPYRPSSPTPAGPNSKAMALVRMMPRPTDAIEEPPIRAEDFRIWPYVCVALVPAAGACGSLPLEDKGRPRGCEESSMTCGASLPRRRGAEDLGDHPTLLVVGQRREHRQRECVRGQAFGDREVAWTEPSGLVRLP